MVFRIFAFLTFTQSVMAMDAVYTFDFTKLNEAKSGVELCLQSPHAEHFLKLVPQAPRTPIGAPYLEKKRLQVARDYAFTFKEMGVLKLYQGNSIEEINTLLVQYLYEPTNLHDPLQAEQKINTYYETYEQNNTKTMDSIQKDIQIYNEFVTQSGPWRDWLFKDFVNNLLGIPEPNTTNDLAEREAIFTILKSTEFLITDIESVQQFSYNPIFPIYHFLQTNPTPDTLILGCGHHIDRDVPYRLDQPLEAYCGMCNLTQCHQGELTIALAAGDIPDVVADMHDKRIWDILKENPEGWKKIADHSWSVSLGKESTLKHIYDSLSPNGIFEIWDLHPQEEIMKTLGPIGFKFMGVDKEKKLMFFGK